MKKSNNYNNPSNSMSHNRGMRLKLFVNFIRTSNTFIAVLVLLVGMSATLVSWQEARGTVSTKTEDTLKQAISDTDSAIQKRIALYEEVLRGAGGLFTVRGGEIITRQGFSRYVTSLHIRDRFPGMQSIGFAQVVAGTDIAAYQSSVQASGFPEFVIKPEGARDSYAPVLYNEPFDELNKQALGYDLLSEPSRRAAMEIARDTGQPAITDTITLLQNKENDNDKGFTFFIPVYKGSFDTLENRRANLVGFVFEPVRLSELMQGIYDQEAMSSIGLRIFDSSDPNPDHLIYQSSDFSGDRTTSRSIALKDRSWLVQASGSADILSANERQQPFLILLLGTGASLLLAAFIFIVMRSRARELAYQKQLDIQQAKDELLSLASHQLRTPATGVKQYLGIVLEGYTGDISKEQRQMLQKANASNERQLEIVNQLLHVTRLETGRLMLRFASFNLTNLMEDIISEQAETIKSRGQILTFKKPKSVVTMYGDEQYLRMAIENLVSNASKYTHADGSIVVTLSEAPDRVTLSVSDTGVGIGPEDQDKLFQKFSRIDNDLSVQAGGSGIGLYLTKEIIELHEGSISVDSDRDSGSTFTIILPKRNKPAKV